MMADDCALVQTGIVAGSMSELAIDIICTVATDVHMQFSRNTASSLGRYHALLLSGDRYTSNDLRGNAPALLADELLEHWSIIPTC